MQTAFYHQTGKVPRLFTVIKQHDNGTVDLADGDTVVITSCPVSADATPGTATLGEDTEAAPPEKKKHK